jgi:hypothetical protein
MKFKVFDVPWHLGHQYEMLKFPFVEWSWLRQPNRQVNRAMRGDLGAKVEWVDYYEEGKYDAAILHMDQESLHFFPTRLGKDCYYRHLDEVVRDVPKIVIMHGTPYDPDFQPDTQAIVDALRELIGKNRLVVNSRRAREQWGVGRTIIHGMNAAEWFDLPKEPRVITVLSPSGMSAYYDRPFLEDVRKELARRDILHCHVSADFTPRSWDEYRDFLGRSLLYFNPTRESPMPRARTEAMFSGCCVLTTPHQDADRFIEDGFNGFIVNRDPNRVADLVEELIHRPSRAIAIGQQGKKTAQRLFDWNRYAGEWLELLQETTGKTVAS